RDSSANRQSRHPMIPAKTFPVRREHLPRAVIAEQPTANCEPAQVRSRLPTEYLPTRLFLPPRQLLECPCESDRGTAPQGIPPPPAFLLFHRSCVRPSPGWCSPTPAGRSQ